MSVAKAVEGGDYAASLVALRDKLAEGVEAATDQMIKETNDDSHTEHTVLPLRPTALARPRLTTDRPADLPPLSPSVPEAIRPPHPIDCSSRPQPHTVKRKAQTALPPGDLLVFTVGAWTPFVVEPVPPEHGYSSDADWRLAAEFKAWRSARAQWADRFGWHTDLADRLHDERAQRLALPTDHTSMTEGTS